MLVNYEQISNHESNTYLNFMLVDILLMFYPPAYGMIVPERKKKRNY